MGFFFGGYKPVIPSPLSSPAHTPFLSSHFSCTDNTDIKSQSLREFFESAGIENCARLQRRTQNPPQNHFRRLFDNMKTSSKSGQSAPRKVHAKLQKTTLSPYSCS